MVDQQQARLALGEAVKALKQGDQKNAYVWAKRAVQADPTLEEAWLILARVSKPELSIKFIEQALKINPNSERARNGMAWAKKRLSAPEAPTPAPALQPIVAKPVSPSKSPAKKKKKSHLMWVGGFVLLCLVVVVAVWAAGASPVSALFGSSSTATSVATQQHWSQATLAKPTYTPSPTPTFTSTPTFTPTPTFTLTPSPTNTPTATNTSTPTLTFTPTNTPKPTKTPKPTQPPPPTQAPPVIKDNGVHWIEVNLTQQRLYAYSGDTLVKSFLVSTGLWQTPTVTGTYRIYLKYVSTTMSGPGYYLTDVPYTMYFYGSYGIHGTYWHNNFGTPMSHGCVNMYTPDAAWLFDFAPLGTTVYVHY